MSEEFGSCRRPAVSRRCVGYQPDQRAGQALLPRALATLLLVSGVRISDPVQLMGSRGIDAK